MVKITGIENRGRTATVLLRGSNKLALGEADRSLHDALCVVRCLVQKQYLIAGGGSPEMELSYQLSQWAKTLLVSGTVPLPALLHSPSMQLWQRERALPCYALRGLLACSSEHMQAQRACRVRACRALSCTAPVPLQGMESYCVRAFAEALEIIPYTLAENAGMHPIEIVTELRNHHASGRRHHGEQRAVAKGRGRDTRVGRESEYFRCQTCSMARPRGAVGVRAACLPVFSTHHSCLFLIPPLSLCLPSPACPPPAGINVRKGTTSDMLEESVVQPLLVTTSAVSLATEAARLILKIDDIVPTR